MTHPAAMALLVGFGGFAGSIARYGLSIGSQRLAFRWPLGTLAANVLGCFLTGVLAGMAAHGDILSPEVRLALATGFCGGFTTMSSMIHEIAEMLRARHLWHATLYAAGTLLLSMVALAAGLMIWPVAIPAV